MSAPDTEARARHKQEAAERAVELVSPGMVVGLGTGSTAIFAVRRIADLLRGGRLRDIVGVPTSRAVEAEARRLGIPLALDGARDIDLTIDGADEVDPDLELVKGGGGALFHEKIVAQASRREVIVVDDAKLSPRLGTRWAVPVEVVPFVWQSQARFLQSLGARITQRQGADGQPFVTDEGNWILDCAFGPIAVAAGAGRAPGRADRHRGARTLHRIGHRRHRRRPGRHPPPHAKGMTMTDQERLDQLCDQHHPHPRHRRHPEGALRASRHADGRGPGGLHALAALPAVRSRPSHLAEPRSLRAVFRPCLHAALRAAPPHRGQGGQPEVRGPRGGLRVPGRHQELPPAREQVPGPSGVSLDLGHRDHDGAARAGGGDERGHGHRRALDGASTSTAPGSPCSTTTSTRSAATAA